MRRGSFHWIVPATAARVIEATQAAVMEASFGQPNFEGSWAALADQPKPGKRKIFVATQASRANIDFGILAN